MLATSVRDNPCNALLSRSSSGRSTTKPPSSERMVIGSANGGLNVPFGPFTVTARPSMETSTPLGTGMGIRPMRDTIVPSYSLPLLLPLLANSPDVGEDFPAHATLRCLPVREQAARGRDDRDTETAED